MTLTPHAQTPASQPLRRSRSLFRRTPESVLPEPESAPLVRSVSPECAPTAPAWVTQFVDSLA